MEKKCTCNEPPNPDYWHIRPQCPVHDASAAPDDPIWNNMNPEEFRERGGIWRARALAAEKALGESVRWVRGTKGFPVRKKVVAKFKHYDDPLRDWIVGSASSSNGEMITFDWYVSSITLDINHERWTTLEWLDESPGTK